MKIKKILILSIMATNLLSCSSATETPVTGLKFAQPQKPVELTKIINHNMPNINVDKSPFTTTGCSPMDSTYFGYMSEYYCKEGSPMYDLGCETMIYSPLLGGLNPNYPTVTCRIRTESYPYNNSFVDSEMPSVGCTYTNRADDTTPCYRPITYKKSNGGISLPDGCIYTGGAGLITSCYRLVTYKEGKYQLVTTRDDFRALFAPVESPEEALSFALATGDFLAKYGQTKDKNYVYFVQRLEDTYVETITDGYIVHVFISQATSCGDDLDIVKSVEINVSHDGYLSQTKGFSVYSDPSLTGCTN